MHELELKYYLLAKLNELSAVARKMSGGSKMTIKTRKSAVKAMCVSAAVLASLFGGQASAKLFDITYSGTGGSGEFHIDATLVSPGIYDVTSIFGNGNGAQITWLSSYASSDNQLSYPGEPFFSGSGLSFTTSVGTSYNLYSWNGGYRQLSSLIDPIGYAENGTPTTLTVAVPELSTWAMMIAGFACLGFVGYRRAGKTVRA
jgi:hypothetical protein